MREVEISYSALETFRQVIEVPNDWDEGRINDHVAFIMSRDGLTDECHSTSYAVEVDGWEELTA